MLMEWTSFVNVLSVHVFFPLFAKMGLCFGFRLADSNSCVLGDLAFERTGKQRDKNSNCAPHKEFGPIFRYR